MSSGFMRLCRFSRPKFGGQTKDDSAKDHINKDKQDAKIERKHNLKRKIFCINARKIALNLEILL